MHTIDNKEVIARESTEKGGDIKYEEVPFFYNCKTHKVTIKKYLDWPSRTILEDVIGPNKVWLKSWGEIIPKSKEDKEKIVAAWLKKIPSLVPISSHRFVAGEPIEDISPVLSIFGSDIVVYGWNMRHYLLNELKEHLDLFELVFDEEHDEWDYEPMKQLQDIISLEYRNAKDKEIPVLEELILYWSSGWSGYGLEYPNPKNDIIMPIVKTYIPETKAEENPKKTFNDFKK